jgi:hypothetical protein
MPIICASLSPAAGLSPIGGRIAGVDATGIARELWIEIHPLRTRRAHQPDVVTPTPAVTIETLAISAKKHRQEVARTIQWRGRASLICVS